MKALRQFALILAVMLPMLAPTMACARPNAQLSPAERACCVRMNRGCGNKGMPASHGCCHKHLPSANNLNAAVQPRRASVHANWVSADLSHPVMLLPAALTQFDRARWRGSSTLPQSPPSAISILRI